MPIIFAIGAALVGGVVALSAAKSSSAQSPKAPPAQAAANPQSYIVTPLPPGAGPAAASVNSFVV